MTQASVADVARPEMDERQATRMLARWLEECGPERAHRRDSTDESLEDEIAREAVFQSRLWEAGWLRLGWPALCGGFGEDPLMRAAIYAQLWRSGFPVPEGMQGVEVIVPMIAKYAPRLAAERAHRYLSGQEVWCQGFSEPDAGSDLASLRTSARADGDSYVINGHKIWISLGTVASHCVLLARTGVAGPRGLTFLFVDLSLDGVTVAPVLAANGRSEFAQIDFEDVRVPASAVIGEPGQGWALAMEMLQWERGMYAWQRHAYLSSRLLAVVRDCAPARLDRIEPALVEAHLAVHAVRHRAYRTVRMLAAGESPAAETSIDKVLLAAAEHATVECLRQAYFPDFHLAADPRSQRLRTEFFYSRSSSVYGGAREVQKNIIAERLLALPRERR